MLEWVISSSVLTLVVIVLRRVLKGKISPRLQYALWSLVLLRLLIPVSIGSSPFSVGTLTQKAAQTETGRLVTEMADSDISPKSYRTAYEEVRKEYADRGIDIKQFPATDYERLAEVDAEIIERMTGFVSPRELINAVWLAGIGVTALTLAVSNIRFAGKLKKSRRLSDEKTCPLPVYVSPSVDTPCLFGLFRPAVYLTPEAAADETLLRHSIAHELTHYRHGDHVWSLLRGACLALHWYNPLVWCAAVLSRHDAELACDEATIKRLGENERAEYGRTLIEMTCQKRPALLLTATTMTGSGSSIKERIMLIAKKPKTALYTLIAVLLIAAVLAGCTFTGAKKDDIDTGTDEAPSLSDEASAPDDAASPDEIPIENEIADVKITFRDALAETLPEEVQSFALEYAQVRLDYYVHELGCDITQAEVTDVTLIDTGTAGLTNGINMYRLAYRFRTADPAAPAPEDGATLEDGCITEETSEGQPLILLFWSDDGENTAWERISATNTRAIETEFGTPEMLDEFGNMYTAAAYKLYEAYREGKMPVTAERTTQELFESDSARKYEGGYPEFYEYVLFTSKEWVTDFRLLSINLEIADEYGNASFRVGGELYYLAELNPDTPLAARLTFPGDLPTIGISYVDASGKERTYTVSVSGRDGSIVLAEADFFLGEYEHLALNDVSFYHIKPESGTLGDEIPPQADGTYHLPAETGVFIDFKGEAIKPVTAYFTQAGALSEKEIVRAYKPFPEEPFGFKLDFSGEDTKGVLRFVFDRGDGTRLQSEYFSIVIEH